MYGAPRELRTRVFARVPGAKLLEGPSFDRSGHLWVTDIPNGRIARIAPSGDVTIVAEYDGEPNGLKIHRDGRVFIADHKHGLMMFDAETGQVEAVYDRPYRERFKGLNDLIFARNGDLYFTDQGESDLRDQSGRLYRLTARGELDCLLDSVPSPNGLVLTPDEKVLLLAVTRMNAVWRVPIAPVGVHGVGRLGLGRVGVHVYLSGGLGPDGMAIDVEGRIAVAHPGSGNVWVFDRRGEPVWRVRCCEGEFATNVAYGGADMKSLYVTEVNSGTVQVVELDVPGHPMFSHA